MNNKIIKFKKSNLINNKICNLDSFNKIKSLKKEKQKFFLYKVKTLS